MTKLLTSPFRLLNKGIDAINLPSFLIGYGLAVFVLILSGSIVL